MNEPKWLTRRLVVALHGESLGLFGGLPGLRDEGLLESALARPLNRYASTPSANLGELAAAYGVGLARNHPFLDGNKRIAVISVAVFLAINGQIFEPDEVDEVRTILAMAAGELSEETFARWIRTNAV